MALRRVFRCLERPSAEGLSAQDVWMHPPGHSTEFAYALFGGHWGTWHHLFTSEKGPKEWVFKPFVDEQTMVGEKGRMIYKQHHMPQHAVIGSAWLCPNGSFKRVLSRGGAWENVNPGSTHPDERDHDDEQSAQSKTEQRDKSSEVPVRAGESTPRDGDDGQVPPVQPSGEENTGVGEADQTAPPGVDANGSEVV